MFIKRALYLILFLSLVCSAFVIKSLLKPEFTSISALESESESAINFQNNIPKMRGVSWVAGDSVTEPQIEALKEANIEWISQTPFGWQSAYNQPEIRMSFNANRAFWGESDRGLIQTTRLAKKHHVRTLLKPHLWLRDRSGKWLGDIEMTSEADWQEWFKNYRTFILHYAEVAETEKMEALCIGTELHKVAALREQNWRALIIDIRKVYSGKLTYAANWYLEYEQIKFWDDLDFIGVQGYFPLTTKSNPTLAELKTGWKKQISAVEKIARKYKKPVVFTEAGYKSTADAGIEPWKWPERGVEISNESLETQAICYEAMFQTVWDKPWFSGIFIWKWYPKMHGEGNRYLGDFTPQNKPAEKVLAQWYGK